MRWTVCPTRAGCNNVVASKSALRALVLSWYNYYTKDYFNTYFSDKSGELEIMSELASKERLFYYQLALIWQAVLTPLLQSGNDNFQQLKWYYHDQCFTP